MANFEEAMKWLKEGKKIRITTWRKGEFLRLNEYNRIIDEEGSYYDLAGPHIFNSKWVLSEEKPENTVSISSENWKKFEDVKPEPYSYIITYHPTHGVNLDQYIQVSFGGWYMLKSSFRPIYWIPLPELPK